MLPRAPNGPWLGTLVSDLEVRPVLVISSEEKSNLQPELGFQNVEAGRLQTGKTGFGRCREQPTCREEGQAGRGGHKVSSVLCSELGLGVGGIASSRVTDV